MGRHFKTRCSSANVFTNVVFASFCNEVFKTITSTKNDNLNHSKYSNKKVYFITQILPLVIRHYFSSIWQKSVELISHDNLLKTHHLLWQLIFSLQFQLTAEIFLWLLLMLKLIVPIDFHFYQNQKSENDFIINSSLRMLLQKLSFFWNFLPKCQVDKKISKIFNVNTRRIVCGDWKLLFISSILHLSFTIKD